MRPSRPCATGLSLAVLLPALASADVIVVHPDGTGDVATIADAIAAASDGDVVELTDGVFTGPGNRNLDFLGKAITVRSQTGDRDACILDCETDGVGLDRAMSFVTGEGAGTVVESITIRNGYAGGSGDDGRGGAMFCNGAGPTIRDCVLESHEAVLAGGAVYCRNATTRFEDTHVVDCTAGSGGAMWIHLSSVTLDGCTLEGNVSDVFGGAMGWNSSTGTIVGSVFVDNGSPSGRGGALRLSTGADVAIATSTFVGNLATDGGAIDVSASTLTVDRSIIAYTAGGGAITGAASLTCSDLAVNVGGSWTGAIAGQLGVDGNISADPIFCDLLARDLTLRSDSPCLPGQHPDGAACDRIGARDEGCVYTGAVTYVVHPDGSGDLPTIQDAILAAATSDTVALGDGRFAGPGNVDLSYLGKAIVVRSISGDPGTCILDGEGGSRLVSFDLGEGSGSVLEGVTLTGGRVSGGCPTGCGGAVRCISASPTLRNVDFVGNEAGGTADGGALYCTGGAAPVVESCRFIDNRAGDDGGALHSWDSAPTVVGSVFFANLADGGVGGGLGASAGSAVVVDRCTFVDNRAGDSGSAIGTDTDATATISASIVAFNGAGDAVGGTGASLSCSDVFGNTDGDWTGSIWDQIGVDGNFSADPLFCEPGLVDVGLLAGSPCLPGQHPDGADCGVIGALGEGCDPDGPVVHVLEDDGTGEFSTIQAAIDAVPSGHAIALADGVYTGDGNRDLDFRAKTVTLRSLSGDPAACILDVGGTPGEAHRGIWFRQGEGVLTRVQNLTIQGAWVTHFGAAVAASSRASPTIEGCVFRNNHANTAGGAMSADDDCTPTFIDCVAYGNTSPIGGALRARQCAPVLIGCTLVSNEADQGAAVYVEGGGGTVHLERTLVAWNSGDEAVRCTSTQTPSATCTDIYGNSGGDWTGCMAGLDGIDDNFSLDPLLCDVAGGDLRLADTSPCLPAASPCGERVGALGEGCTTIGVDDEPGAERLRLTVGPNPFRAALRLSLVGGSARVRSTAWVDVYDVAGRRVARVPVSTTRPTLWPGARDLPVAAGVYFLKLDDRPDVGPLRVVRVR